MDCMEAPKFNRRLAAQGCPGSAKMMIHMLYLDNIEYYFSINNEIMAARNPFFKIGDLSKSVLRAFDDGYLT